MRFEFYDTNGELHDVTANIEVSELRAYLSEFKTHCIVGKSAYQFNHFVNWLRKYYGISINQRTFEVSERIDM
jgi:hypothetical protein